MKRSAVIAGDHRLELRRIWDVARPLLVVCMLNPSRADGEVEDPTLLTLIHFARLWGYGGLLIVNLYSYRASKPAEMFAMGAAAIGEESLLYVIRAVLYARDNGGRLLVAWGNEGQERAPVFIEHTRGVELVCLGTTQSGAPKHPMARGKHRIPRDQQPIVWRAAA
ncbi:MAG: hypothetical protein JWR80_7990 [Bradyrhizobium sp.]|nr:hypothetical protein [Bradyrhizobium sp.]